VAGENDTRPPLVASIDGKDLVTVPFVVEVAGAGTTPSRRAVELVAVTAPTADVEWRTVVELEPWADDQYSDVSAVLVGVHDQTALLRVSSSTW
jgi:hypothetical protein